ncbi:MAG TPA: proline--tRNA ligase [Alphaproteobacteria bacterium]|jgi:prolyl-tRNA synthetase|nr:proline--tRNA ligase [Alphaproteobacteria bacterium]
MKYSQLIGKTSRQKMPGSEVAGHQLLLRAGFITPVAAGIYSFLPLGFKVLENIDRIIKEEFTKLGIQHILMPFVHPATLWEETGRFAKWQKALAVFDSKHGGKYLLAPTHEETVTDMARKFINSYKDLPVIVNQNQWKYRDEVRVNGGLLRTREFLMQDAYSFDKDEEGLEKSFELIKDAYHKIFARIGIPVIAVKADSGAIGGSGSEEFMVESFVGEDRIFVCGNCDYKANIEKAESIYPEFIQNEEKKPMEMVEGKGIIGVEPLAKFLNIPVQQTTKTLLYQADEKVVAVCVRGEYQVSEVKLANLLGCMNLSLASAEVVKKVTQAEVGYAGPIGLPNSVEVIWDLSTQGRVNFECGGNKTHYHNINVNFDRDVKAPEKFVDIREVKEGEICIKCEKGKLTDVSGIELGHVFKLGTIYSKAMNANFVDKDGKSKPIIMGCYGIGITRVLAALVEVSHDDKGIIWPKAVAPFDIHLVELPGGNGEELYNKLTKFGFDVLWDDRDIQAGQKFADADLIGIPVRLVVSAKTGDKIEYKERNSEKSERLNFEEVVEKINN